MGATYAAPEGRRGHGGPRAFVAMAVALVAAAVGAGFAARIFRRKEGHVLEEEGDQEREAKLGESPEKERNGRRQEGHVLEEEGDQKREAKMGETLEKERNGRPQSSFLENHSPPSPPLEDYNERRRETGGGDHVEVGAPLHVSDTMTKDDDDRSHGSSEEKERVSDTTEDDSVSSDAYIPFHSWEEFGMKYVLDAKGDDDKEAPTSGKKKKKKKKKMVSGEGDQDASGERKVMVRVKNSVLCFHLTLSLAVVLAVILLLLLLGRHHDRVLETCHLLRKVLHHSSSDS